MRVLDASDGRHQRRKRDLLMRSLLGYAFLVVALFPLGGCASAEVEESPSRPPKISVDRINRPGTLADLRGGSVAVVTGRPVSRTTATSHGFPITLTTVEVEKVIVGSWGKKHALVSQLGTEQYVSEDTSPLLQLDQSYLLYLNIENDPDGTKRTVITGADGVYKLKGKVYEYAGGPGSSLPSTIELDDVI
ncbi:hypothetical protein [Micromonospora sp. L32]|uniref:hypothetical protein n=1 Tax=Micromonospora TaxID=1873 RepID=UPI003F8B636B